MTLNDTKASYINTNFVINEENKDIKAEEKWLEIELNKRNSLESYKSENLDSSKSSKMDFDDILPLIGEFGKYQKILFLYMIPFEFFLVFIYFTQIFLTLTPEEYWCNVPELDNLTTKERYLIGLKL